MTKGTLFLASVMGTLVSGDIAYQGGYETRFDYDYYNDFDHVNTDDCLIHGDCDEAVERQSGSDVLANILDPLDSVRTIFNVIDLPEIYTSLTSSSNILQQFIKKIVEVYFQFSKH